MTLPVIQFFNTILDECVNSPFASIDSYRDLENLIDNVSLEDNNTTISIQLRQNTDIQSIIPIDFTSFEIIENHEVRFNLLGILKAQLATKSPTLLEMWEFFEIETISYIFPNIDLNGSDYNNSELRSIIIKAANNLKIKFNSRLNDNVDIRFILRLLAVCDRSLSGLIFAASHKQASFNIIETEVENLFQDRNHIQEFLIILYDENVRKSVYFDEKETTSIEDIKNFEEYFRDPAKSSLLLKCEIDSFPCYITIFRESEYTLDLIHIPKYTSVKTHVNTDFCKKYSVIVNGPFYDPYSFNHNFIGSRKFRVTHDIPKILYDYAEHKAWFYPATENPFVAHVIVDKDKTVTIDKDLLTKKILESDNTLCAFDGVTYSYSSNLSDQEQPCNPNGKKFSNPKPEKSDEDPDDPTNENTKLTWYHSRPSIGNLETVGRPFFGIIDGLHNSKYIFTLTIPDEKIYKNPDYDTDKKRWQKIFTILKTLNPKIAVFTDGSDSVFLKYKDRLQQVGFGKNLSMPCLIGIIKKSDMI